ncbi:hypothetical protein BaRGS_00020872 [Batillaria attramentaria]|uniref:Cathepsin L n=1 Tax=Batillaria attramentaria TaxID=370345 RepID=A0ABD0KLV9_9CAEN
MFRYALAALLLTSALCLDLEAEWSEFKKAYRKSYSLTEEPVRRAIWQYNLNLIQKHNLEADRGQHTYWLGMNHLGDMTTQEVVQKMNGLRMNPNRTQGEMFQPPSNMGALPKKVDWRDQGYVTPVKNQESCGSCWAFSTTGSLEGQTFKKTGKLVSLSEQNLVDCSKKEGNHGCQGGLMDYAFKYIQDNKGIDTEASYPYLGKNGVCNFQPSTVGATDTGYVDIKRYSEEALQQAVATVGPISIGIDASRPTFHLYKSGVYYDRECSSTRLDHGVLAVGYGEEGIIFGKKYWLVKNSWGAEWGMQGYIMMERDKDNACGVATQASYPKV